MAHGISFKPDTPSCFHAAEGATLSAVVAAAFCLSANRVCRSQVSSPDQEFADFQCPYCLQFHNTIEGPLVHQYVKTGKVRFEYHHFVIIDSRTGGHESESAAEASECANAQGKFWPYHDMLFANQGAEGSGAFSNAHLTEFATTLGLDLKAFNQCFSSGQYGPTVQADVVKGLGLGVQGTPTIFINGVEASDPFDLSGLKTMIDTALAKAS
jgi:protein-disulfide isomerase